MMRFLLLCSLCLAVGACDSQKPNLMRQPPPPPPEAPLKDLNVQNYEISGGQRLRVIDADGKVIIEGEPIPNGARIYRSRGFVAYTYEKQGTRLKTFNYQGRDLHTDADLLTGNYRIYISDHLLAVYNEKSDGNRLSTINKDGKTIPTASDLLNNESKIFISENIIAYTAQSHSQGKLLSKEGNAATYEAIPTGLRLHAFNRYGDDLNVTSNLLDSHSHFFVTGKIVAYTSMTSTQGQLLKEEGNVKTYAAIPTGRRLFAKSYLGVPLAVSSEPLNDDTKITVEDSFILINKPGRRDAVYLIDGSVR